MLQFIYFLNNFPARPVSLLLLLLLLLPSESLKDLVSMEVDPPADVKNELPTPPASDVGSPTSFSHCGSDSEPDSPFAEDSKVGSGPPTRPDASSCTNIYSTNS